MEWGWSAFYAAVTLAVLLMLRRDPAKGIALALFANVVATSVMDAMVPIEASPGIKVVVESMVILATLLHLFEATNRAIVVLGFSLAIITLSMAFAVNEDRALVHVYEVIVNVMLLCQCVALVGPKLIAGVGHIASHWRRRHGVRGHGLHGRGGVRMEAAPPARVDRTPQ